MEINKSELFKKAHAMAKTMEGNYRACFALALIKLYKQARQLKLRKVIDDKFLISTATVGDEYETIVFRADGSEDIFDYAYPIFEYRTNSKQEAIKVHNEQVNKYVDLAYLFTFA